MVPFSQITKRQKHYGGGLLLVRLKPASLLKLRLLHGCFSHFLNCTNSNKSRKTSHIVLIFCFSICIFSCGYWRITRQKGNVGSQKFFFNPSYTHLRRVRHYRDRSAWDVNLVFFITVHTINRMLLYNADPSMKLSTWLNANCI